MAEGQPNLSRDIFSRLALISALKDRAGGERDTVGDASLLIAVDHELDLYLKNQNTLRRAVSVPLDTELCLDKEDFYRLRGDKDGAFAIWSNLVDGAGNETLIRSGRLGLNLGVQSDGGYLLRQILGPQPAKVTLWDNLQLYQLSLSSNDRN